MTQPVKVPDPVYDRLSREAERRDVPRGVIVKEWMNDADRFAEVEQR